MSIIFPDMTEGSHTVEYCTKELMVLAGKIMASGLRTQEEKSQKRIKENNS
jgi:hypothetical protein